MKMSADWFRLFREQFLNFFWFGLVIVLVSIIINAVNTEKDFYLIVVANLLETIGIALLVGSIFSFAVGTTSFMQNIRRLLEDIIVSKNFLSEIGEDAKSTVLKTLLIPSQTAKNAYPNIGNYYNYYITKTLNVNKKNIRSNYKISARAFFDKEKSKICVESTYNYRLYPNSGTFNHIQLGFPEPETGDSICHHVIICSPTGDRDKYTRDKLDFVEDHKNGDISCKAEIDLQKYNGECNHLDVEIKITEYGSDHWQMFTFIALQPTDGFCFKLHCDDEITIKKHAVFVVGANYHLEEAAENEISVTCYQWINAGSGLCIVVSRPQ